MAVPLPPEGSDRRDEDGGRGGAAQAEADGGEGERQGEEHERVVAEAGVREGCGRQQNEERRHRDRERNAAEAPPNGSSKAFRNAHRTPWDIGTRGSCLESSLESSLDAPPEVKWRGQQQSG